jgi:acetyltransferase-like isoleucine patch superfamily enzyme
MSQIRQLRARAIKLLNDLLPGRPSAGLHARVSFRAKLEGHTRNIHIESGACVREAAWLNCMDAAARIEIGRGTLIMPYAKLVAGPGGFIRIGRDCSVHSFDVLYGFGGGLTIGDGVRIGTGATFISANHNIDDPTLSPNAQGATSLGVTIGDHSWIGAGAIILDGVTLGPNTVVGAGAVVTSSMPADAVCVGVPARLLRQRGETRVTP